jgi:hypothetical protein
VVCYVEVRSNKENRSEAVSAELIRLGAKIEKYFTKKVTDLLKINSWEFGMSSR